MIPHGHLERRRVPRLASVKVRGGIPAAFWALAAYAAVSLCASRVDWAQPYFEPAWLATISNATALVALAALMPDFLRRDGLLEGDLGWRPWTLDDAACGAVAGLGLWFARRPFLDLLDAPVANAAPLAVAGVLAAVLAETFFRGFLIGALRARYGRGPAATTFFVLLSAALFALAQSPADPVLAADAAVLGLALGGIFAATRSLNVVLVAHAALNVVSALRASF